MLVREPKHARLNMRRNKIPFLAPANKTGLAFIAKPTPVLRKINFEKETTFLWGTIHDKMCHLS